MPTCANKPGEGQVKVSVSQWTGQGRARESRVLPPTQWLRNGFCCTEASLLPSPSFLPKHHSFHYPPNTGLRSSENVMYNPYPAAPSPVLSQTSLESHTELSMPCQSFHLLPFFRSVILTLYPHPQRDTGSEILPWNDYCED